MNHLGIDGTGRVVFDAGDAVVEDEEEEEELDDDQVDIARLRDLIPSEQEIASMTISETLGAFHFSTDANLPDLAAITGLSSFNDEPEPEPMVPTGEEHDFFGDEDFDNGGGPSGGFDDDGMSIASDGDFGGGQTVVADASAPGAFGYGPFDPRRAQGQGFALDFGGSDDPDNMFQYFDAGFGKAWAGAEHWKLKKISRKGELQTCRP
jgi:condensin complex subunit 2